MKESNFNKMKARLNGISRRDFMKYCSVMASTLGLSTGVAPQIAEAITNPKKRPPVIWLHGQECTGCTETLLRTSHPGLGSLILDIISLDYHETLLVGSGHQAEESLQNSIKLNDGKFVLVIEGAIPVKNDGKFCMIGGKTFLSMVEDTASHAAAIIAYGSCSSWGGIPSASPNPTGATGAPEILKGKTVVTIPGCPPNPYNFLSTVVHFLTFGKLPAIDGKGRPKFAYGRLIHENCERRPHFDAGRFAEKFGDDGHRQGYCLYKLGCKGPETYANCPDIGFNDLGGNNWPVGNGHPCFGCTEGGVGFSAPLHSLSEVANPTPFANQPSVNHEKRGKGMSAGAAALVAGAAGAAVGAGTVLAQKIDKADKCCDSSTKGE